VLLMTAFRRKGAEAVCRVLGGDLSLVDEIQRRHAQVAGTPEEAFLLASSGGNQGSSTQVALPQLPYTLGQLQQMQAAADALVATKAGIQQCAVVLHEFPMGKFTQYIDLKGQELQLNEKQLSLSEKQLSLGEKQFGLRQKEDEHGLRMDAARGELEERAAKRRRFDTSDAGVTFASILQELASSSQDARGFQQKAKQMKLALEVYKKVKDQLLPGSYKPRQYEQDAGAAIAEFIQQKVQASNEAGNDLRIYFTSNTTGTGGDTGHMYDD